MSKLHECDIAHLRPTQITVGMIEVEDKRKILAALGHHERREYLEAHPIPAVRGPEDKLYITDHHHLGRALHDDKFDSAFFLVEADLSAVDPDSFWEHMHLERWTHPVDAQGKRCDYASIPHHLQGLIDDPYRSLAGYVRNAGGYEKTPTAFAEFLWADFFRKRIALDGTRAVFNEAVERALALAHSEAAHTLPGYLDVAKR
jgi:hypothetical protein